MIVTLKAIKIQRREYKTRSNETGHDNQLLCTDATPDGIADPVTVSIDDAGYERLAKLDGKLLGTDVKLNLTGMRAYMSRMKVTGVVV